MTIHHRSLDASSTRRKLLFVALAVFAVIAITAICLVVFIANVFRDHPKDVTNDPRYLNFSTVTGRWKTKQPLNLVQHDNLVYLWTTDQSVGGLWKLLATLPPGTQISVEHLIVHPSWEAGEIISRNGSLVSGPYAGKTLELDPSLFARNAINGGGAQGVTTWQVDPNQLEK